ncbi:MAG: hypothetical protein GY711_23825 [bacterium]|nr:hypothetical protein [bacterium]
MLRSTIWLTLASALTASAVAQTPTFQPYSGTPQNAGVYRVATGTLLQASAQGPGGYLGGGDVVYANDAFSGHFNTTGMGFLNVDSGVLATDANAGGFSVGANREFYEIKSFDFSYCTDAPSEAFTFTFYDSFVPCTDPAGPTTTLIATIPTSGLPGSSNGSVQCFTVTIDLSGGSEFCIQGDGGSLNPGWDDDVALDSFGWGYQSTSGATTVGAIMAGDPSHTPGVMNRGSGTYYHLPAETRNTGLGTDDQWWTDDPTLVGGPGCYDFGGYSNPSGPATPQDVPYASFYLVLRAGLVDCSSPQIGTAYCDPAIPHSRGIPTTILAFGSDQASANDVTLVAVDMPFNQFGFFICSRTPGFFPNPGMSQGIFCLGGDTGRFNQPALVGFSGTDGTISATIDMTVMPTNPVQAVMPGQSWYFQCWHRDQNPTTTSNFSNGLEVVFL